MTRTIQAQTIQEWQKPIKPKPSKNDKNQSSPDHPRMTRINQACCRNGRWPVGIEDVPDVVRGRVRLTQVQEDLLQTQLLVPVRPSYLQ
jgi:hypothetical protein